VSWAAAPCCSLLPHCFAPLLPGGFKIHCVSTTTKVRAIAGGTMKTVLSTLPQPPTFWKWSDRGGRIDAKEVENS